MHDTQSNQEKWTEFDGVDPGLEWLFTDPAWDMDHAHDLINHFTTAFLLAELYGDEDAAAALASDAVQFPGIIYETTNFLTGTGDSTFQTGVFARVCGFNNQCEMALNSDGTFTYSMDNIIYARGTYRIDGDLLIWITDDSCADRPATYTWSYQNHILVLSEVETDPCSNRRMSINDEPHEMVGD